MVIETVAASAIAFLSPYFIKAGGKFAESAGEKLGEKVGELYNTIKNKFAGNSYASETLERVEKEPDSKAKVSALEDVLTEQMREDATFANLITRLIQESKKIDSKNVVSSGERSVAIGGDATQNTIITGDNNKMNKT